MVRRVVVNENLIVQPLNDEAVALDLNSEIYFSMNSSAYYMWQVLTSTSSIEQAVRQLCEYYEVPEDVLRNDIDVFVRQLSEHHLIEVRNAE